MDIKTSWEKLKAKKDTVSIKDFIEFYNCLHDVYLSDFKQFPCFNKLDGSEQKIFYKTILYLIKGNISEVGSLPQIEISFIVSLYFILNRKRVFILYPGPIELSAYQELFKVFKQELELNIGEERYLNSEVKNANIYNKDIVFTEYIRFATDFYNNKSLLKEKPTVAIINEIDLCLYDRRILFFKQGNLKATACVYGTEDKKFSLENQKGILDFKEVVPLFDTVCGLSSASFSKVRREILKTYALKIKHIKVGKSNAYLPALVFKNELEKIRVLCKDVSKAQGDVLIFFYSEPTHKLLSDEFAGRGYNVIFISTKDEFRNFIKQSGKQKKIGLFQGLPRIDWDDIFKVEKINVFWAEHFPFLHHHKKISLFCSNRLNCVSSPNLYFSLKDDVSRIYTENVSFSRSFKLIEFVEARYPTRWVRKVIAKRILSKIYRLRHSYWNEKFPLLTSVFFPPPHQYKRVKSLKKGISKRLSTLCFCGSGKKFKDCHGKI